jgi:hypothetical protein
MSVAKKICDMAGWFVNMVESSINKYIFIPSVYL